jgi:hypothetical protein
VGPPPSPDLEAVAALAGEACAAYETAAKKIEEAIDARRLSALKKAAAQYLAGNAFVDEAVAALDSG